MKPIPIKGVHVLRSRNNTACRPQGQPGPTNSTSGRTLFVLALLALLLGTMRHVTAADWPTYRHDNRRSCVTPERLDAGRLAPAWTFRSAQPPRPAWAGPAKWDAYAGIRGLRSMREYDPVFQGGSFFTMAEVR